MKGEISEIILFNRALTSDERGEVNLYLSNKWNLTSTVDSDGDGMMDADDPEPTIPLVAWYQFNDSSDLGKDSSGFENNLSIHNNEIVNYSTNASEGIGSAEFDGGSTFLRNDFGQSVGDSFSIAFWLKNNNTAANTVVLRLMSSDDETGFILQGNDNLNFNYWVSSWQSGPKFIGALDNYWHHCVIVVDGENIYLYKDGSIHDQMLDSGFREIGNSAWLSLGSEKRFHFNGNLDDVRIYNKALTASEISTLFTNY